MGTIPAAFVDLFAKVGIISYDLDVNLDTDDGEDHVSSSDEDIAYGIGAAFNIGKLGIRAEAERFAWLTPSPDAEPLLLAPGLVSHPGHPR